MPVDRSFAACRPPTPRRGIGRSRAGTPHLLARCQLLLSAAVLLGVVLAPTAAQAAGPLTGPPSPPTGYQPDGTSTCC